jgi:hypothetical protein
MPQRFSCQLTEFWRKGLKGSNRSLVSIARHGYDMLCSPNVNARRIGMNHRQACRLTPLLALLFFLRMAFDW